MMGFFVGRSIIYFFVIIILYVAFSIYSLFFADIAVNYFTVSAFKITSFLGFAIGIILAYLDPMNIRQSQMSSGNSDVPPRTTSGSSSSKAAFLMGAAAYAKASKKPKFPVCRARDSSVRNIQVKHLGGNKWKIYYQVFGVMGGNSQEWVDRSHTVTPSVSGFSAGRSTIDINWQ